MSRARPGNSGKLGVVAAGVGKRLRPPSAAANSNAARRLARKDGVSLNLWISSAGSQKVGSVETAAAFFKHHAGGADGAAMMRFLVDAPDLPEESGGKGTVR